MPNTTMTQTGVQVDPLNPTPTTNTPTSVTEINNNNDLSDKLNTLLYRELESINAKIDTLMNARSRLEAVLSSRFFSSPSGATKKRYRLTTPEWQELVHDYIMTLAPGQKFIAKNVFEHLKKEGHIPDNVMYPSNSLYLAIDKDTDVVVADDSGKTRIYSRIPPRKVESPLPAKVRRR